MNRRALVVLPSLVTLLLAGACSSSAKPTPDAAATAPETAKVDAPVTVKAPFASTHRPATSRSASTGWMAWW
jgi:hypothetical protein